MSKWSIHVHSKCHECKHVNSKCHECKHLNSKCQHEVNL